MPDPHQLAAGLSEDGKFAISFEGIAYGRAPFAASVMRPLERRGLFTRIAEKGFQVRWEITPLGLAVRAILEERNGTE